MMRWIFLIVWSFSSVVWGAVEPPPAERVFQFQATRYDPNTMILTWHIQPGFFLYQEKIHIIPSKMEEKYLDLMPLELPEALSKKDSQGKTLFIYRNQLQIPVHIIGQHSGETTLTIQYQGCSDDGFCYPPTSVPLNLKINQQLALSHVEPFIAFDSNLSNHPTHSLQTILNHPFTTHWFFTLLIFLGLGVLLSFTPCVFPMIPVLSGIIVGRGAKVSTRQAFLLSFAYVMSMSITYACVGALIATMGQNLQVVMQTPLLIGGLSLFFVILALAMFNLFELKLPTAWQSKLANISYHQASGHYLGAMIMGCLSTLILSPCVTAPLMGALAYIANTGNILLGITALFFLGLGMGIPLLLIGTSLGKWLPKAGIWMNDIKSLFGIVLLGVAIDLSSRILPPIISMLLWSILFIFAALILGLLRRAQNNLARLKQGLAILCFVYGLLILIGMSQGHTNPWLPLKNIQSNQHLITVTSVAQLNQAVEKANIAHQPILIDFYADWCRSCKIMEQEMQSNAEIQTLLSQIAVIKVDVTANNSYTQELNQQFNVVAPPAFIYISKTGRRLDDLKQVGEISPDFFKSTLQQLLSAS